MSATNQSAHPGIFVNPAWRDAAVAEDLAGKRKYTTGRVTLHLVSGGFLILVISGLILLAPWLSQFSAEQVNTAVRMQPPSATHPLGTDSFGRDMLSRVLYGGRVTLWMAFQAVMLSGICGGFLGILAGFYRGRLDGLLSRVMEVWMSIPGLLMAIVLIAKMGPSLEATTLALGMAGIPGFYRLVRAQTLSVCCLPFVEAARALGASDFHLAATHILPNISSSLLVLFSMRIGTNLLAGSGLSFIGLGAQPPNPEWGALLSTGRDYLDTAWWLAVFPGLAITLSVIGCNLFGDGLRDFFAWRVGGKR